MQFLCTKQKNMCFVSLLEKKTECGSWSGKYCAYNDRITAASMLQVSKGLGRKKKRAEFKA